MYFVSNGTSNKRTTFVKKGRPRGLSLQKLERLKSLYYSTSFSLRKLGTILDVSSSTILRAVHSFSGGLDG